MRCPMCTEEAKVYYLFQEVWAHECPKVHRWIWWNSDGVFGDQSLKGFHRV